MTKKEKLVWRLGKLPTVSELTELVNNKIITQDEAREILLNKEEHGDRDIKSYQEEIKFLRELVEKLSKSKSEITTIIKEIELPSWRRYAWYQPYWGWYMGIWMTTDSTSGSTSTFCPIGTSNTTTSSTADCVAPYSTATSFSDIKTF